MGYTRSRGRFFQLCISGMTRSVMLLMVSADMRLPNCSSRMSLILSRAVADGVQAYDSVRKGSPRGFSRVCAQPADRKCRPGRAVCLLSLLPSKSAPACSCGRSGGCPTSRSPFSRWLSISPSKGAVKQILQQRCQYSILAGKRNPGLQLFNGIRLELFIIK